MLYLLPFALALVAERVVAHGGVIGYSNGGKYYDGFHHWDRKNTQQKTIARPYDTIDPLKDIDSPKLSCYNNGQSFANQQTATVEAGSKLSFHWGNWVHKTGPLITYLGKCPGDTCNGVDSSKLKWFKIDEAGLLSGNIVDGLWAATAMRQNNHTWTATIPSQVPNGNYIVRHETIALHALPAVMEFYPSCAQIKIVNGGSRTPTAEELVSFPGGYRRSEPGFGVSLYNGQRPTTYVIPGPPVYGSSSGSAPKPAKPAANVADALKWGKQCGGINYKGKTVCAANLTCKVLNKYYHQCL